MASTNFAQTTIPLYSGTIPNSKAAPNEETTEQHDGITIISKISLPTLSIFLPPKDKANGTAVVICPGGGYGGVAFSHEGIDIAKWFNDLGVSAFVFGPLSPRTMARMTFNLVRLSSPSSWGRGIGSATFSPDLGGEGTSRGVLTP